MNDEWETPLDLFYKLEKEFGLNFDLCTSGYNNRCDNYTTDIEIFVRSGDDKVGDTYWMNPPYSRGNIDMCMEQAVTLVNRDHTVICLVRFDPSTQWFQKYVHGLASEVRMLDKRVKFQGADSAYNFPCCVVIYDNALNLHCRPTEYVIWGWD